jgi:AGCS family alanine or glycine:cation symporter
MEQIEEILMRIKDWVWGPPLLILLLGTGIYLTWILRGVQFKYLAYAFRQVYASQKKNSQGDISHFESLMTTLAGAIGTGSIIGVATAVAIGGTGAIFWMWVTAFFGMATKYAESLLAVKYRTRDKRGEMCGGPMEYIERGLGWKWMAVIFAVFGAIAAIGTGNLVQVNAISECVAATWSVDMWMTGVFLAVVTGIVVVGGVRSIGHVASVLVPVMALLYIGGGLIILIQHASIIPQALGDIVKGAFGFSSVAGGVAGGALLLTIQMGVSRSIFSNEAGLGISSIAAAAAITDSPSRQALINMTGALISTIVVCSITGLVLAVSGVIGATNESGELLKAPSMAIEAFNRNIPGGAYIVTISLILFAYSTVVAWAYYGEKCFEYLLGEKGVTIYRVLFTLLIIPGAALKIETVWTIADIMNGFMVVPNLIALIGLSHVITTETQQFLRTVEEESRVEASSTTGV